MHLQLTPTTLDFFDNLTFSRSSPAADSDFTPGPFTISFAVGASTNDPGCVSIPTEDDDDVEGTQQLIVSIVTDPFPTNVFPLSPTERNVLLFDNDGL